jgi:hypothetical protein
MLSIGVFSEGFGSGFEASSADNSNPFVAAVFVDRSH